MPLRHLLPLIIAALAAAPTASAQYQWRDANGRMVYSDMPPPASVPPSAVLRAPARQTPAVAPGGSGATASASRPAATGVPVTVPGPSATGTPAPTIAEREMEFRKRRLEREQAERKASEAQAATRRAASACNDARTQVRTIESGMRMAQVNERGEREIVDEAFRAAQLDTARKAIRDHCPA